MIVSVGDLPWSALAIWFFGFAGSSLPGERDCPEAIDASRGEVGPAGGLGRQDCAGLSRRFITVLNGSTDLTAEAIARARQGGVRPPAQNPPVPMIVFGIDPGTANTGYGVVGRRGGRLVALDGGVIETTAGGDAGARLARIHARVGELIDEHAPEAVAVEDLYFGANARSAFAVGQARGVVLLAAGQRGIPCRSYTPQQVKGAVCGSGRAGKEQVQRMVQALLALAELPRPDHAADALAVAICHANGAPLRRAPGRGRRADRALLAARSPSAAPTTSSSPAAASATGSPSPPRRCATSPPRASRSPCTPT